MEVLANATKTRFSDLNQQVQANSKMTLQNRQALDLLLAQKHGLCGYLHLDPDRCCTPTPNVTEPLQKQ